MQRGWVTPAACNRCNAETVLARGIGGYLFVACSKFRETRCEGRGTGYEGLSFVPQEAAPAAATMVGPSTTPMVAATALSAAPVAATLEDDLREGPASSTPVASAVTVEDSTQMERALQARLQQATMAAMQMTEAQVTSLFSYLQSERPMQHARAVWADIHKQGSPKKKARISEVAGELFRAEAARLARRGDLQASETLRAAVPIGPLGQLAAGGGEHGNQEQLLQDQQHMIQAYAEQIAISENLRGYESYFLADICHRLDCEKCRADRGFHVGSCQMSGNTISRTMNQTRRLWSLTGAFAKRQSQEKLPTVMRMAARYDVQKGAWLGKLEGRKRARAAAVRLLGTRNREAAAAGAAAIYAAEESAAFVAEVRNLMTV